MEKRLSHALALAGVASRRASEKIIAEGRVKVNGERVLIPMFRVNPSKDRIEVNGRRLPKPEKKVYFLVNKPRGMLCTSQKGPARILLDLFFHLPYRLFTVGRLDQETTGLIIVTNDGDFAHSVMHPSFGLQKEYLARVSEEITFDALYRMTEGVVIDGVFVKPLRVKKVRRGTVKIVVGEGKKHEVRKILEHGGLTVRDLVRIRIGPLHLGNLAEGTYRELLLSEIEELMK